MTVGHDERHSRYRQVGNLARLDLEQITRTHDVRGWQARCLLDVRAAGFSL